MDWTARKVIVPLDGTDTGERALPTARALAGALDAPIELVRVVWHEPAAQEESYLAAVAGSFGELAATTRVGYGLPGPVLGEVIDAAEHPLVCMSTRGRGGMVGTALGSVADELLLHSQAPFALLGPSAEEVVAAGRPLILCFDGSPAAFEVVPLARMLAEAFDAELRVAMVLHRHGDYLGNEIATPAKNRAETLVKQLAGDGFDVSLSLLDGIEPAHAIVRFAREISAGWIVAATHGSSGIVRGAVGSTAMRVIHHVPCPVVVRRPT